MLYHRFNFKLHTGIITTLYFQYTCIVHLYNYSIHLCITLVHTRDGVIDRFIKDITDCVAEIMKDPKAKAGGQVGLVASGVALSCLYSGLLGFVANRSHQPPTKVDIWVLLLTVWLGAVIK